MRQYAMQLIVAVDQRIEVMGSMFFKRVVELKLAADKFTWRRQSDRGRHPAPGHVIAVAGVEVPVVAVGPVPQMRETFLLPLTAFG